MTATHVAWELKKQIPKRSSPLLVGDELYFVSDLGVANCVNARTGEIHWSERLSGAFSASPVYADGRIYFLSEKGETVVIADATNDSRVQYPDACHREGIASMVVVPITVRDEVPVPSYHCPC